MICRPTNSATAQTNDSIYNRFKKLENESLAKPYEGIHTSKGIEKGLFPVKSENKKSN
jgi:hypothetical protein